MNMEEKDTTIKVSQETRKRIEKYKVIPEEPIDKVINRLMDIYDQAKKKGLVEA